MKRRAIELEDFKSSVVRAGSVWDVCRQIARLGNVLLRFGRKSLHSANIQYNPRHSSSHIMTFLADSVAG